MQSSEKVKGVVDMVFLMDATGSMQPCIDALKHNLELFVDSLTTKGGNNPSPVKDGRAKVVGFRDFEVDSEPYVDNPFVRDPAALKSQLAALEPKGGGDSPESLLDAIFKVANMGQTEKDAPEDPQKWRYRRSAARIAIIFTDTTFKPTMALPEAKGGTIDDVRNACTNNRIILSVFAPDDPCYNGLSEIDRAEYMPIPAGDTGLEAFTGDAANFKTTLEQLAKSVSKSSEEPPL